MYMSIQIDSKKKEEINLLYTKLYTLMIKTKGKTNDIERVIIILMEQTID